MQTTEHTLSSRDPFTELLQYLESPAGIRTCPRTTPVCHPPCACAECETHFYSRVEQGFDRYTYTKVTSDSEANAILKNYVTNIHDNRTYLLSAIWNHGDKILKRWRKRTLSKRVELLKEVEPTLPTDKEKLPRIQYAMTPWCYGRKNYRNVYLLPYLDTETLAKNPSTLIGLLHYRSHFQTDQWAQFDHNQLTLSWACGILDVEFNKNCVIMHGTDYGKLVPWDLNAAHRSDIIGFPRAQLILEAQSRLVALLRKVVQALLSNVSSDESPSAVKWYELVQHGMKKTGDVAYWSSFTYQPYSAPPVFDIDALLAQAKTRLNETGDHLWLLQTEPQYIRRYSRLIEQMYSAVQGRRTLFGAEIVTGEIIGDADKHWFWQGVVKELEHARNVFHQHRDSIHPRSPLPKKVDDALGSLEVLLVNGVHLRSRELQVTIAQRPGFQHHYDLENLPEKHLVSFQYKPEITSAKAYTEDPLWWCLTQLQGAPDDQQRFPYAMLFGFLDDHLASSRAQERSRIDEVLYAKLSDFATIIEMLCAVRMHYPKCTIRYMDEIKKNEDRLAWRRYNAKNLDFEIDYSMASALDRFQKTNVSEGKKDYKWLQDFNASHDALQGFWKTVQARYKGHFRKCGYSPGDVETNMQPISLWESSEYHNVVNCRRQNIISDIEKAKANIVDDIFLPFLCTPEVSPKVDIQPPKIKIKTRGKTTMPTSAEVSESMPRVNISQPPLMIKTVPKRTLATFRSMFPLAVEERQRVVDWDTFVLSMEDAGFTARNGGGSIVTFEDKDGKGKIIFHRPHPVPKLDSVMLQSMGRRMNKWFGWKRELFALAGK